MHKTVPDLATTVAHIADGITLTFAGFGGSGAPNIVELATTCIGVGQGIADALGKGLTSCSAGC